jgi:hypothetical protein
MSLFHIQHELIYEREKEKDREDEYEKRDIEKDCVT